MTDFFRSFYKNLAKEDYFSAFRKAQKELMNRNAPFSMLIWIYGNPALPIAPKSLVGSVVTEDSWYLEETM